MNLIICCTPFHVLIAKRIIQLENADFIAVLFDSVGNKKYHNAYLALLDICKEVLYVRVNGNSSDINRLLELFKFKLRFNNLNKINFNKVFIANIDNIAIHSLISGINFLELNTFDDGTANIQKDSHLYNKNNTNLKSSVSRWLLNIKYDIEKIRELSSFHYTIYRNASNIIGNTKLINLFPGKKELLSDNKERNQVKIFLSQPTFEHSQDNFILFERAYNKFKFDYYFPHPREKEKYNFCREIESDLIIEDFILQQLDLDDNVEYVVYSFFSSAIVNLCNIDRVKTVAIYPQSGELDEYSAIYDFFSENGINIESI